MKGTADGEEFARFVTRNRERLVRRYARDVDGNFADAEDLVQDGLIDLARQWPEVESPGAWMHRVCERGAARVIRRHEHPVRGALPLEASYAESLPANRHNSAATSYAYTLAEDLVSGPLEWAMLKLDAEGCTHAEIAELVRDHPVWARRRMGCTKSNVGKVLRREKERLSREISQRLRTGETSPEDDGGMIMMAVLSLPRKQLEAFGLRILGFEPVMIAKVMDSKPMTARANLSHANRTLADAFGMEPEDATTVPQFVTRCLAGVRICLLIGAALATLGDDFDLKGLMSGPPGSQGSRAAVIATTAVGIGRHMVAEKADLSLWVSALTEEYVIKNVVDAVNETIRQQLGVPRKREGLSQLRITLDLELSPR